MSLSPSATSNTSDSHVVHPKRRRTDSVAETHMSLSPTDTTAHHPGNGNNAPAAHIPKRGARACTACRKGKNRCEGDPHKYATYGIVPSTAPSSDDESEDTLPRASLNAPIEALQGLANAAAEAAAATSASPPRVKKRKRAEPIPRNAFPHVVEKGLVSDAEARELYHIFFAGCHLFIPLFDPAYDTYESLMERTPWTFDAILAIASKIRSGNGPLSSTFYKCLEEAQGIARSSLFGPVVRKEAVMGMLLLAAWSTNGWLPSGHAMRMALDLGLHRALEKLADENGNAKPRTEEEERDLDKWWADCDDLHRQSMDEDSLLRKILVGELHYAKLWLVCVALRGVAWDKMPFEQRELAFQAKDAAASVISMFLTSNAYRAALRYAVHDSLVTAAFSGLFLLKMANLFPTELDLGASAMAPPPFADGMLVPAPFSVEELGMLWPDDRGDRSIFNPSTIPLWLQEQSLTDLGLPVNGSDGIFLQIGTSGWAGDFAPMPEAW
ncbi:hypothetical protein ONZ45_g3167 [Pleurotus djamor]|nr:hypothetical protein ONZ45_g3167 [Pleurotus djamor]